MWLQLAGRATRMNLDDNLALSNVYEDRDEVVGQAAITISIRIGGERTAGMLDGGVL